MLVEQIGVSRYSIYADFGNMQGLFEAALERYNDELIDLRFGPLERSDAGLSEVLSLLDYYGSAGNGPAAGRGCLLCNTAVEFGPNDPTGSAAVQRYFERLSGAFSNALGNARARGELDQSVDPAKEAGFLTATVLGVFVMLRANAPREAIENAAGSAIAHLEGLAA